MTPHTDFIARKDELSLLNNAFTEAKSGMGKMLMLAGTAGVGKSAFVRHFISEYAENDTEVLVSIAECNDKENLNAYAPFKEILIQLVSAQKPTGKNKLRNFIKEAGTSWIELIPVIGSYAKVGLETYEAYQKNYGDQSSEGVIQSENDVFRIFENEFRRLAADKTLVIFIDDLQWADASSLNLIFGLGKGLRAKPYKILFIGAYRPDEIKTGRDVLSENNTLVKMPHPFLDKLNLLRTYTKPENYIKENDNWFQEIALDPFSFDEYKTYIKQRYPNNTFSNEFLETTFNITDGHPLFVVEIMSYLEKNDMIYKTGEVYTSRNIEVDDLPTSIDGVISEKVNKLNEDMLKILSYASINGEKFVFQVIEKILQMDEGGKEDKLVAYLEDLIAKHELIKEIDSENIDLDLFSFSQSLVHQFVYQKLSKFNRKRLHKKVAAIMKEVYGNLLDDDLELKEKYNTHIQIGQGLIDGVNRQLIMDKPDEEIEANESDQSKGTHQKIVLDAVTMELEKASNSYELYAMEEALAQATKAIAMLSIITEVDDQTSALLFDAYFIKNKALQWSGKYQEAFEIAEKMLAIAKQSASDSHNAKANLALAKSRSSLGFHQDALTYFNEAIEIFKRLNNTHFLWDAYQGAGLACFEKASYNDAISYYDRALIYAEKLNDAIKKGRTFLSMGSAYSSKLLPLDKVLDYLNRALKIFSDNKNKYWEGMALNKIGNEYRTNLNNELALEYLSNALKIAEEQNDLVNTSHRTNNIALVYESMEDYDKSIVYYERSLAIDTRLDDKPMMAMSLQNIGSVYSLKKDHEAALRYLDKSKEITLSINNPKRVSSLYSSIAKIYNDMDDFDKSGEYYQKAIDVDSSINDEGSLALNSYFLGNLYYNNKQYEEATSSLHTSIKLLSKIGRDDFIAIAKNLLGLIAKGKGEYENAKTFFLQSLEYYSRAEQSKEFIMDVKENLADTYYQNNEDEKSIDIYKEAIELATELEDHLYLRRLHTSIANAYFWSENYTEALEMYKISAEKNFKEYGDKSIEFANIQEHIADTHYELNNYNEAIGTYNFALKCVEELKANNDFYAVINKKIGNAYLMMDDNEQAANYYEKELDYRIEKYGEHDIKTAYAVDHLANNYFIGQDYLKAIDMYKRELDIYQHLEEVDPKIIDSTKFSLGESYYFSDQKHVAKIIFTELSKSRKELYGDASEQYATLMNYLDDLDEIEVDELDNKNIEDEVNEVIEEPHSYHVDEYNTHIRQANDLFKKSDFSNALPAFNKAYLVLDRMPETEEVLRAKAETSFQIAETQKYMEEYETAVENYIKSYNLYIKLPNVNVDILGLICVNLGDIYNIVQNYEQAIKNHLEAIQFFNKNPNPDKGKLIWTYLNLAHDLKSIEKYDDAIINYRKALQLIEDKNGKSHRDVADCYTDIGKCFFEKKDVLSAVQNLKKALHIYVDLYGEDSRESDDAMVILGQAYFFADRITEAEKLLHQSLNFRKEFYGDQSEAYTFIKNWIAEHLNT